MAADILALKYEYTLVYRHFQSQENLNANNLTSVVALSPAILSVDTMKGNLRRRC